MKLTTHQNTALILVLSIALAINFIDDSDNVEPEQLKQITTEQQLINGWAQALIMRCMQKMEKDPNNNACLTEIKEAGYKLRTRNFWLEKGFFKRK